jgi:hypothetical protein
LAVRPELVVALAQRLHDLLLARGAVRDVLLDARGGGGAVDQRAVRRVDATGAVGVNFSQ